MEGSLDKDCSAYGGLFLTIMSDLRSSAPVWEDFCSKAMKLHTSLKTTLTAITAFLEAFQKIADMATGSRGATKEIGTALTRLCMRHKTIETKLKKFTGTILENLVNPLQEVMEDWKKTVVQLDKERTKEYKKSKAEIKKCASDTVRLQKKVKKGKSEMQSRLDSAMQDVNDKYILLEEQEKNAVRTAMIEERSRYCLFITCLKPFVDEEVSLLTEVTHLSEIMESLSVQADSPKTLPQSSEQVILDLKGNESGPWNFQQSPPSSPSSIGSRKSSMCSINSIASSSSGSAQSHSPCHNKNIQQSSDNVSQGTDTPEMDSTPSTPSESYPNTPSATSTWTNWPNPPAPGNKTESGRPHTISSAYEKSHARPALSSSLFEPPQANTLPKSTTDSESKHDPTVLKRDRPHSTMSVPYSRPSASINKMQPVLPPLGPKPKSRAVAPPKVPPIGEQPVYANLSELVPNDTVDADKTPTSRDPPTTDPAPVFKEPLPVDPSQLRRPPASNGAGKKYDGLDLSEAIRDLDNYTAALHGDFSPEHRRSKMQQNSMELAAAIKELEASTAALESSYSTDTQASQHSLQCSSGYGTMNSTPANSEDTIASGGIPVSAQGGNGGGLMRRSSLNQPKPPPPVRRSSSITSSSNPAVLQKYRGVTPPRQVVHTAYLDSQAQQNTASQPNHRRSHSAAGSSSGSEPAYAELQEIQQSIQARYQQGSHPGSQPTTPQYALPVTTHPQTVGSTNVINSLNAKFATMNSQNSADPRYNQTRVQSTGHPNNSATNSASGGDDFPDLPPPPTENELREIEKIYNVPNVQQTQNYNTQTQNNVQLRHTPMSPTTAPMGDMVRQSLISEMKAGNKFRKLSTSEEGSEC